jgi:hypothetical protein
MSVTVQRGGFLHKFSGANPDDRSMRSSLERSNEYFPLGIHIMKQKGN